MKILIVDDEEKLALALAKGLTLKGFATDVLHDGVDALNRISLHGGEYDLVVLDLMLPGVSGTEITKTVRELNVTVPILILTAQSDTEHKVDLLLSGADDYMVKPFSFEELVARIHAVLRRPKAMLPPETLTAGVISLHPGDHTVTVSGAALSLTLKEFSILEYLLRHPNEIVKRDDLLFHLWDFNYDAFSNVVDVHVKNLRKKLNTAGAPDLLEAVRGVGYRLRV